ncbi:acyltransferase family protein [Aspergillus saccharolyticus JOP 1030-1]|uniref:Acyltransferase 3 domain-containing protein n=1 Tax=Aspergillus saccharolyticus JOP 1030-1 TaxID=1450539 RepID=A0A318ZAZ5_9EURO|nr:hypothetical protein BP01DRAFT_375408 [Aspergillus saccharolyticus JOP 1030-1]PYH43504.1 hypothetical protein BP01DRAFT_375408 [Aspergillus saccharolyticus JOP 1030-1]
MALLPYFITSLWRPNTERPSLRRTSPLDGLRGVAALCVVNYHIISAFHNFVNYGYGLTPEEAHREPHCAHNNEPIEHNLRLHQLPIIRLVYSGSAPVCIFFVLSGFVLSYRSWQLVRARNLEAVFPSLSSSTFRRGVRLFLPTTLATLITMIVIQTGAWDYPATVAMDRTIITAENEYHQPRLRTFGAQTAHWASMMWNMTNVFAWEENYPEYDVHLWTIPMEFRASLLLFLILLVVVRLRYVSRVAILLGLIAYCYGHVRWVMVLFLAGSLLAESSLRWDAAAAGAPGAPEETIPPPAKPPRSPYSTGRVCLRFLLRTVLVFIALYFLSAPDKCIHRTPGYRTLARVLPAWDVRFYRVFPSVGAILLVGVVSHSPKGSRLARVLDLRLVQYLGWISYSLYIVHGPLMHGVGYRLFPLMWRMTGHEATGAYLLGFFLAWSGLLFVVFWVADRFAVAVDDHSVRLGRWLEGKLVEKS